MAQLKRVDSNGYIPSILQDDYNCLICLSPYTARHEVFGAANRQRSKLDGLWVCLCPEHHEEIHRDARKALALKRFAQNKAMDYYGWTVDDFRQRYGKNYL